MSDGIMSFQQLSQGFRRLGSFLTDPLSREELGSIFRVHEFFGLLNLHFAFCIRCNFEEERILVTIIRTSRCLRARRGLVENEACLISFQYGGARTYMDGKGILSFNNLVDLELRISC